MIAGSSQPWVLVNEWGDRLAPWTLQRAIRTARANVPGLRPDFRFHDLRHYLVSMLIASGADVKVVQVRLRHASAKTTPDAYAHLWPDSDESARAAFDAVMNERIGARESLSRRVISGRQPAAGTGAAGRWGSA